MSIRCKLIDFNVIDSQDSYNIEMFGIDEKRDTYYINVTDFKPFVYIKIGSGWKKNHCDDFIDHLKSLPSLSYFAKNIISYELVEKKSLYGFDAGQYYKFIYISCINTSFINKLKTLYYDKDTQKVNEGYKYGSTYTRIYECMIPPILRFFHIQKISPSGWVKIDDYNKNKIKNSTCKYDINCKFRNVIGIDDDTIVNYLICSFDIEANSSHGDFPEAIKNYKKVGYDIAYYISNNNIFKNDILSIFKQLLLNVFGFKNNMNIDICYLQNNNYTEEQFNKDYNKILESKLNIGKHIDTKLKLYFKDEEVNNKNIKCNDIITLLSSNEELPIKTVHLIELFDANFPKLKGDEVTFIGSTFVKYGESEPFLNHCISIANTKSMKEGQIIESYNNEKDILCAWSKLIQKLLAIIYLGLITNLCIIEQ